MEKHWDCIDRHQFIVHALSAVLLALTAFEINAVTGYRHTVPMGRSKHCDKGNAVSKDWDGFNPIPYTCKLNLPIPWTPDTEYPCPVSPKVLERDEETGTWQLDLPYTNPHHVCTSVEIRYSEPYPSIGKHRPAWPRYGVYKYLPPQRWLHNLEHGAIVALYHPCVSEHERQKFINLVACAVKKKTSMYKMPMFIATPEVKIPKCQPFVLLAWRNRLLMSKVLPQQIEEFTHRFYHHGPEKNYGDGQYSTVLEKSSRKYLNDNLTCNRIKN